MKYKIFVVEGVFLPAEICETDSTLSIVYSLKQNSFYRVYKGTRCITDSWRRGLHIDKFKQLSFVKEMKIGFSREIRRKDFAELIGKLKLEQNRRSLSSEFIILDGSILKKTRYDDLNSHIKMNYNALHFQSFMKSLFKTLIKFTIIQMSEGTKKVKILCDEFLRQHYDFKEFLIRDCANIKAITCDDYNSAIALKYLLLSQAIKVNRFQFIKRCSHNYNHKYHKIRRILIITNLNGAFSINEDWDNSVLAGQSWHHVASSFTRKSLGELISRIRYFNVADLIIYRGHSKILDGHIAYPLEDGTYFLLDEFSFKHYVHLACFDAETSNSLNKLPAVHSVLPLTLLRDKNYYPYFSQFLHDIQKQAGFVKSAQRFLALDQSGGNFNLWS